MKKAILISAILVVAAILAFNYFMPSCVREQEEKIAKLEEVVQTLKAEANPMAFQINERTDSTILFSVKFLDQAGNEVGKYQQTIKGSELFFDFFSVKEGDLFLAFPDKVFSDAVSPQNGIDLKPMYDKEGFPMVFYTENQTEEIKKALTDLFATVKTGETGSREQFGSAVHDLQGIKTFEPGIIYKIITHTKGGIEIIEN